MGGIPVIVAFRGRGRRARLRGAWASWGVPALAVALLLLAAPAAAQDAPARLAAKFLELVQEQGLAPDQVALLVLSVKHRSVLVQHRASEPMPAASNTKLITVYAGLRALSPNFRWRTRVSRIADHDGAADAGRQAFTGLLVEGAGDPTLTYAQLETLAQRVRAAGIRKLSGGLYLDDSLYGSGLPAPAGLATELEPEDVPEEADGGPVADDQTVLTPPRAFIVEHNAPELLIALPDGGGSAEVLSGLPPEAVRIAARLQPSATRRSVIRAEQAWDETQWVLNLSGSVTPGPHTLTLPVTDPTLFFAHLLRAALRRQGIEGALPLRRAVPAGARRELLFSTYSPPLRDAIAPILRDSDNLAADSLLWTLAVQGRPRPGAAGPDLADGLRWVQRILQQDFPGIQSEVELADGSGLNADSRISARALVRVLHGALGRPEFAPEFIGALSRAGWDGTLHYRSYPPALQGRLRAKTGTLTGVQNLTGTFPLAQDELLFSFLVNAPGMGRAKLQAAQDRIVAALFTLLKKEEIVSPDTDPLGPRILAPPPASPKPGRKHDFKPPAASPKPKASGGGGQTGVG